jgi:hypothetical protein
LNDKELIYTAANVATRAPQEWAAFIIALSAHVNTKRDECIRSPLDMLQVTQGRAQASGALRDILADCVKTANELDAKKPQRPQQPR